MSYTKSALSDVHPLKLNRFLHSTPILHTVWKVPGSNPACAGIFSGSSHTSDFKIGTPVATLPGAWRYRVSTGTGRPGVSILWLGEVERLICNFYLSVAARKIVCCWDAKQPTNKQTNPYHRPAETETGRSELWSQQLPFPSWTCVPSHSSVNSLSLWIMLIITRYTWCNIHDPAQYYTLCLSHGSFTLHRLLDTLDHAKHCCTLQGCNQPEFFFQCSSLKHFFSAQA